MKKLASAFVAILFSGMSYGQTTVGGVISSNTYWNLAGSPYIINSNLLVNHGVTLSIEPGVVVKFNKGFAMQVRGALYAKGNATNKITFTSNATTPQAGDWKNISFTKQASYYDFSTDTGSVLKHCIIEYGGENNINIQGVIQGDSVLPYISNCKIANHNNGPVYLENASFVTKTVIDSCLIENNNQSSITAFSIISGKLIITNNTIKNCKGNSNLFTIEAYDSLFFKKNIITNCSGEFRDGGFDSFHFSDISYNVFNQNNRFRIYMAGIVEFKNNIITMNETYDTQFYTNASELIFSDINPLIFTNNIIAYNLNGTINLPCLNHPNKINNNQFYFNVIEDGQLIDPYDILIRVTATGNNDSIDFYNNTITRNSSANSKIDATNYTHVSVLNNNIFNNEGYAIKNYAPVSSPDISVKDNWWGTTNDAYIQQHVFYDWTDDGAIGIIDYQPILSIADTNAPISPPDSVIKKDLGNNSVVLTWKSNPENDLMGYKIYWGNHSGYSFSHVVDVGNVNSYTLSGAFPTDITAVTAYDKDTTGTEDIFNGNESWYAYDNLSLFQLLNVNTLCSSSNMSCVLFPNPANEWTTVRVNNNTTTAKIIIYDMLGGKQYESDNINATEIKIYLGNLRNGIYMVRTVSNDAVIGYAKLVIEH